MRRALLDECRKRPLAEVSVAGLVRRAGLGRAAFYRHDPDLDALAVDACAEIVRDAVERRTPGAGCRIPRRRRPR